MLVFGIVATNGAEAGKVDSAYAPEGTAITNAAEFAAMAPDGKYYLASDITIDATWNGGAELNGTASSNTAFTGTFDGNGKTITTTVPLFGLISGTVKNLTVAGDITSSTIGDGSGVYYSAALAYYAKGNIVIENVVNNANVSGANVGAGFIAVVHTYSTGTLNIKDCVNNGKISTNTTDATNGTNKLGGFVAYLTGGTGTLDNCVNNGELTSTGGGKYNYVGGIVGQVGRTTSTIPVAATCNFTIKNCVNNANVTSENLHCAGIVAFLYGHLEIIDTINNGDITNIKAAGSRAAGILGTTGGTDKKSSLLIDGCVNNGVVRGSFHAAGIAAYFGDGIAEDGANGLAYVMKNTANYGNVYLDGTVKSTASYMRAGGIAAYAAGGTYNVVENCVNMGDVYVNLNHETTYNPHVSSFIGYVNNKSFTLKNNINTGNLILDGLEAADPKPVASMIAFNNQASLVNTANNYSIPAVEGAMVLRLKDKTPLEDETMVKAVTAEQVASGEAVWTLNNVAGTTVFYQNLTTGKISTKADGTNTVYKLADGTFSNTETADGDVTTTPDADVTTTPTGDVTTPEAEVTTTVPDVTTTNEPVSTTVPTETTATPEGTTVPSDTTTYIPADTTVPDETTNAVENTTAAPDETTAKPVDTTAPEKKGCGGFVLAVQLVAILGAGITAVIVKKK